MSNSDFFFIIVGEIEKVNFSVGKKNCCVRWEFGFYDDVICILLKSLIVGEIISWYYFVLICEVFFDVEEDRVEKINYGLLSFGNWYSFVLFDCILLLFESL